MKLDQKNEPIEDRLIRLPEVLQILPLSKSTWWEGVRTGKYPQPVKLGKRITCWRLGDIRELIEKALNERTTK